MIRVQRVDNIKLKEGDRVLCWLGGDYLDIAKIVCDGNSDVIIDIGDDLQMFLSKSDIFMVLS